MPFYSRSCLPRLPLILSCCYLTFRHGLRNLHGTRNTEQVADRVMERVTLSLPVRAGVEQDAGTPGPMGSIDMDSVSKAVEWWAEKAEQTDKEIHRVGRQGVRWAVMRC